MLGFDTGPALGMGKAGRRVVPTWMAVTHETAQILNTFLEWKSDRKTTDVQLFGLVLIQTGQHIVKKIITILQCFAKVLATQHFRLQT